MTENNQIEYPSAEISFNVVQQEYQYELNRSIKLDNKINMTITFCGVIFLFIIKYLDLTSIFNALNKQTHECALCFIKMICCTGQIAAVGLFIYSIITLIKLLKNRGYLHFNCDEIFDNGLMKEKDEITRYYISTKYLAATSFNNMTNEKRSKEYDKVVFSLIMLLIICIVVETLKCNFLGIGGVINVR